MRIIYDTYRKEGHTDNKLITTYKHIFISTIFTMKNNLFKKFLAVFLTGTMLAGVGCKDYDDDIDSINKRLDGMDVTVADLQTQITNVKNSIPTLDELNKKVKDLTDGLTGVKSDISSINKEIDAIGDVQAKLNALKSDLQAYVDGKVQSSEQTLLKEIATKATASDIEKAVKALKDDLDGQLQTINDRISKLEGVSTPDYSGDIQALKDRLEKLDGANGEVKKLKDSLEALGDISNYITKSNLADEINNLKETPSWLGEAMTDAIEAFEFPYVDAAGAADAAVTELLNKMGYANQDYTESLIDLIKKQFTTENLSEAIGKYEGTIKPLIEKLDARMLELEGRIQSMVFVPSSLSEAIAGIYFEASQSIELKDEKGEKKTIQLGTQVMPEAEMKFRVSPAAAVAKIQAAYKAFKDNNGINPINIVPEKINITRADTEEGTFTVTATTDYKFGSEANKTLAIAVNVTIANANDKKATEDSEAVSFQGIDFTSAYIGCYYNAESATLTADDFVVAYKNEKGDLTEYDGAAAHATELQYNKEGEKVTFFDGFGVYYKTGDQKVPYAKLDTMWNGALASLTIALDAKKGVATVPETTANKGVYELTNVSAMILSGKSNTGLINDVITSKAFAFSVKGASEADYTLPILANAVQTIKITAVNTDVKAETNAAMMWKYAIAKKSAGAARNIYAAKAIKLESGLSADLYKKMAGYTQVNTDDALTAATEGYLVTIKNDKGEVVKTITASLNLPSQPSEDGDSKSVEITFTGDLKANATYAVEAVYKHADKTTTTIKANVVVTGMPVIKPCTIPAAKFAFNGSYTYTLLGGFADLLWDEATLKGAFVDQKEFAAAIAAAVASDPDTETKPADKMATLEISKTEASNIDVVFAAKAKYDTAYTPSLLLTDSEETGLTAIFTSTVTMTDPSEVLTLVPEFFTDPTAKIVQIKTDLTGEALVAVKKELRNAYVYNGKLENYDIVYSLNETEADLKAFAKAFPKATVPSVDGNILDWGDWNKLTLKLKAELKVNGKTLNVQEFTAAIINPVDTEIKVIAKADATIYADEAVKTLKVASLLQLAAQNGAAIDAKTNVFNEGTETGLTENLETALDGEVTYSTDYANKTLVTVDEKTGVVTFLGDSSSIELVKDIEVNVTVAYVNRFGKANCPAAKTVTVKITKGTKPAPAN